MKLILSPASSPSYGFIRIMIPVLLVFSAILVFFAPFMMPDSYSWISNVISESAAQNIAGAWVAKSGLMFFGLAVLWLSSSLRSQWARGTYWFHITFGVLMIATATFANKPWINNIPYDEFEDFLHSFVSTLMGIAFAFGVSVRFFQRKRHELYKKCFDISSIIIIIIIPIIGWSYPPICGIVQRFLIVVGYMWYGSEAFYCYQETVVAHNEQG